MAKITIITVGNLKEGYLKEAMSEYKKRIKKYADIEEIELKEERISNESDPSEIKRALDAEGCKILSSIPDGATKVALCVEGKEYSSEALASIIEAELDARGKIAFIIGSSHGLSNTVKSRADTRLSFSKMTFPHQLMRVMLCEAVYRSLTIIHGAKYHK